MFSGLSSALEQIGLCIRERGSQQTAVAFLPMGTSWVLTCREGELLSPCFKTGSQITHKQRVLR